MKHTFKNLLFLLVFAQTSINFAADPDKGDELALPPGTSIIDRLMTEHLEARAVYSTREAERMLAEQKKREEEEAQLHALKGTVGAIGAGAAALAAKTLAGPALQRSVRTRVFGIDDAVIASAATSTVGAIGSKAVAAIPITLAVLAGGYGLYRLNRMLHAECRNHVDQVKFEMGRLLQKAERERQRDQQRLIERYDEQIRHMETHIEAAQGDIGQARDHLDRLQVTLRHTRETNEAMKAKMAQAMPLIARLVAQTSAMADSARVDVKDVERRTRAELADLSGATHGSPGKRKKKSRWKFWQ